MRPFQTIAQILVAISVVNCALAAPSPELETQHAGEEWISPASLKNSLRTGPVTGLLGGLITGTTLVVEHKQYVPFLSALSCQC